MTAGAVKGALKGAAIGTVLGGPAGTAAGAAKGAAKGAVTTAARGASAQRAQGASTDHAPAAVDVASLMKPPAGVRNQVAKKVALGAVAGGGIPGALLGASSALLKSRQGRAAGKKISAITVSALVAFVLMLASVVPSTTSGAQGGQEAYLSQVSAEAAAADGVPLATISTIVESSADLAIPWQILAALVKVQGAGQTEVDPPPLTVKGVTQAVGRNESVGPYKFLMKDLRDLTTKAGYSTKKDFAEDYGTRVTGLESSTRLTSTLLARHLASNYPELDSYALSTGGTFVRGADDKVNLDFTVQAGELGGPGTSGISLVAYHANPKTPSPTRTATPTRRPSPSPTPTPMVTPTPASGTTGAPTLNPDAVALKEAYLDALEALPIDNAATIAPTVYDTALSWITGNQSKCVANVSAGFAGQGWSNPTMGRQVSPYGMRTHPKTGEYKLHDGLDISAPLGQAVYAAGSGTVRVVNESWSGSNNLVYIDHGNGIETEYGHMSKVLVTTGQVISAGTQVGEIGSEGLSTGPHLHFMLRRDKATTDPVPFFKDQGITLGTTPVNQIMGAAGPAPTVDGAGAVSVSATGTAPPSQVGPNQIRVASANIKSGVSDATYLADLNKATALGADFIGLQEANQKPNSLLARPGYALWRSETNPFVKETPVLWRTDRWDLVNKGSRMTSVNTLRWGPRGINWATLREKTSGKVVSFISVHQLTHGFAGVRYDEYGEGMDAIVETIQQLQDQGPVIAVGDFNIHYQKDRTGERGKWPRAKFSAVGMVPTFDKMGILATGRDHGATIDYIWYQPSGLTPVRHRSDPMISDHLLLWADFELTSDTTAPAPTATGPDGTVTTPNASLPESLTVSSAEGDRVTLNAQQIKYAAAVSSKGTEMGLDSNAIVIAMMTVFVESRWQMYANDGVLGSEDASSVRQADLDIAKQSLKLPYDAVGTDSDSVGLFQQRNSWGTVEERMNAGVSAGFFFERLKAIPNWSTMPKGDAAQKVQVSAFPSRYAVWEEAATTLAQAVSGAQVDPMATDACATPGMNMDGVNLAGAPGSGNAQLAIAYALAQVGDAYSQAFRLGPNSYDCSGLMLMAWKQAGVTLPNVSYTQAVFGAPITREQLQPGDLIFYNNGAGVHHVAMYLGVYNGQESIVHAANPRSGVLIDSFNIMSNEIRTYRRVSHLAAGAAAA